MRRKKKAEQLQATPSKYRPVTRVAAIAMLVGLFLFPAGILMDKQAVVVAGVVLLVADYVGLAFTDPGFWTD
ncbi:hypothetical protein ACFL2Q_07830 [Thermodesulfobacteriota bacterium]